MQILDNLLQKLYKGVTVLINFLLLHFRDIGLRLWAASDGIAFKFLLRDFWSVILNVGFMAVFQLLALLIFLYLPQGKDTLLIVVEDLAGNHNFGNLAWLLIGLVFWSIVSEYAVRYAIYVTDNSGISLSAKRVHWRKELQQAIADIFLVLPSFIVLAGLLFNYVDADEMETDVKNMGFGITALLVYLVLNGLCFFYFNKEKRKVWRHKGLGRFLLLPPEELAWCEKLTGIYNDFVFDIRKPSSFLGIAHTKMSGLAALFLAVPPPVRNAFPQHSPFISDETKVPAMFRLRTYSEDRDKPNGYFRWQYHIPNRFYHKLHKQLGAIVGVCALFFITVLFLRIDYYQYPGAPGLLLIGFACWSGLYLGVLFVDFAVLRRGAPLRPGLSLEHQPEKDVQPKYPHWQKLKGALSLRMVLVALLLFSSWVNFDHPVRVYENIYSRKCNGDTCIANQKTATDSTAYVLAGCGDLRKPLRAHFVDWFGKYMADSTMVRYKDAATGRDIYPVVFVCAEGGALRTGAFSSVMLGLLQDTLMKSQQLDFRKYIYGFSGVSGGSLGVSFFNAIAYLDNPDGQRTRYKDAAIGFFKNDFLAPVIGKMFYGDILNLFIPWHVRGLDRAIALEQAWETGYDVAKVSRRLGYNVFDQPMGNLITHADRYPALFINTTEVETGLQCWVSNVKAVGMPLYEERDLIPGKLRYGINYSTMINFSTRFPLFSPAACLIQRQDRKLHYVDGGYVDNTGAYTMLEMLKTLKPQFDSLKALDYDVRPFVIMLRFSEEGTKLQQIDFANEISEILNGIYNTRAGRVKLATLALKEYVEDPVDGLNGRYCNLCLTPNGKQVPMNWVLSTRSLGQLDEFVDSCWKDRHVNDLKKLFFVDQSRYSRDTIIKPLP